LPGPRAVADTNVWVAAAVTPGGACGQLLNEALERRWEPVVSPLLVEELGELLARAKFRRWLTEAEAERFVGDLRRMADEVTDPPAVRAQRVQDPDDEFLVALVGVARVEALVSGTRTSLAWRTSGRLSSPRRSSLCG
jgi:putative PIN family toxin of toxin-antitoxin system